MQEVVAVRTPQAKWRLKQRPEEQVLVDSRWVGEGQGRGGKAVVITRSVDHGQSVHSSTTYLAQWTLDSAIGGCGGFAERGAGAVGASDKSKAQGRIRSSARQHPVCLFCFSYVNRRLRLGRSGVAPTKQYLYSSDEQPLLPITHTTAGRCNNKKNDLRAFSFTIAERQRTTHVGGGYAEPPRPPTDQSRAPMIGLGVG
ncbi:hypothetical protein VTN77DRAFT_9591 [Rasamsonia byssochlamydoides]|uniref:uncharacterized protein n=1 Tax=Rasamsonia byssochlamydoides TaxID=89139 RepID=UPI003742D35C